MSPYFFVFTALIFVGCASFSTFSKAKRPVVAIHEPVKKDVDAKDSVDPYIVESSYVQELFKKKESNFLQILEARLAASYKYSDMVYAKNMFVGFPEKTREILAIVGKERGVSEETLQKFGRMFVLEYYVRKSHNENLVEKKAAQHVAEVERESAKEARKEMKRHYEAMENAAVQVLIFTAVK